MLCRVVFNLVRLVAVLLLCSCAAGHRCHAVVTCAAAQSAYFAYQPFVEKYTFATMKSTVAVSSVILATRVASAADANPLGKVIELMDSLTAKIVAEGEAEAKAYKEFFEWCDNTARTYNQNIQTVCWLVHPSARPSLVFWLFVCSSAHEFANNKIF